MVDKKTIGISALITLGLFTSLIVGTSYFDNPKYYCEAESSIMECPGELSGGLGTRCYLNTNKSRWDYCKSGWIEITNDLVIQGELDDDKSIPDSTKGTRWLCSPMECMGLNII